MLCPFNGFCCFFDFLFKGLSGVFRRAAMNIGKQINGNPARVNAFLRNN